MLKNISKTIHKPLLFLIVFMFLSIIRTKTAFAQNLSLTIYPPLTELTIMPGKQVAQIYELRNDGTDTVITPRIYPFEPKDIFGNVNIIQNPNLYPDFSGWFSINVGGKAIPEGGIPIKSGESQKFTLGITPPADTAQKDYYFTLTFESNNTSSFAGNNYAYSKIKVGSNILISVSEDGNPQKSIQIEKFTAPKLIDSLTKLSFLVQLKNTGSAFTKPQGQIIIDPLVGKTQTLTLAPQNILVGSTRQISCLDGENVVECKPKGKVFLGIYKSTLKVASEGQSEQLQDTKTTVAFPFSLIFSGLTLFFLLRLIIVKLKG